MRTEPGSTGSIPLVGTSRHSTATSLRNDIARWIDSEPFTDLVRMANGQLSGTLEEQLAYLDGLSAAAWDFRSRAASGQASLERNQIALAALSEQAEARVIAAAELLGMVSANQPRFDSYDHVLTLGGLVRACVWRAQYAAYLTESLVAASDVTALTAFRKLATNEKDKTLDEPSLLEALGRQPRDYEVEVMEDAMADAFKAPAFVTETEGGTSGASRFRVSASQSGSTRLMVVAAPDPRSEYRADTASTMRYWAEQVVNLQPGDRILNVTSTIYVPYQHAVAVQTLALPYQAEIDTVGIDHSRVAPLPVPQYFGATHYLQEMRSTIRAFRSLNESLKALDGSGERGDRNDT